MAMGFTPKEVGPPVKHWDAIPHAVALKATSAWTPSIESFSTPNMIDPTSRLLTPGSSSSEHSDSEEVTTPIVVSAGEDDEEGVVSVSSSFHPGSHDATHDAIFRTTDSVLFYVHSSIMKASSPKSFEHFLSSAASPDEIIDIPESSAVLNVILHALYNKSCVSYAPTFDTLEDAVDRMGFYRIVAKACILPGTHLFNLLLTHGPLVPLRVYCLAAHHQLHDLAVRSSSYTLTISVSNVSDDMAQRMGAVYLKSLMFLHIGRRELFKKIVLQPPEMHPATKTCGFNDQRRLGRAWALAAAYLAWEGKIDIPINTLQTTFAGLEEGLECAGCVTALKNRVKEVAINWAAAKRTI